MEVVGVEAGQDPPSGTLTVETIAKVAIFLPHAGWFGPRVPRLGIRRPEHAGPKSSEHYVNAQVFPGTFDSRVCQAFEGKRSISRACTAWP